ncbi:MAG: hypothetical protein JO122_08210 [Acetobacteraceae bacterium]|nr:hypothetical protein [Acetobacteraceae bacterium]
MKQPIPLDTPLPGGTSPDPDTRDETLGTPGRKPGLFRRAFRGVRWLAAAPVDWLDTTSLRRGMLAVSRLAANLRAGPRRDRRFKTEPDGQFDLQATAFAYGLTVRELEEWLAARRRQTAFLAYATFGLACLFLLAWVHEALGTQMAAPRIMLAIYFLPFCVLFFLVAFYNSLLNFQIRMRRMTSWREYLITEEAFLPR